MPRIQVLSPAGLHHHASGFHAWEPGVYEFPEDPAYAGWLAGQMERGNARLAPELEMVFGTLSESLSPELQAEWNEMAERNTAALETLMGASGAPINDLADVRKPAKCTATTKAGAPCSAWALEGSDRCRMHPKDGE